MIKIIAFIFCNLYIQICLGRGEHLDLAQFLHFFILGKPFCEISALFIGWVNERELHHTKLYFMLGNGHVVKKFMTDLEGLIW